MSATFLRLPGGGYQVDVRVRARKLLADSLGLETELPVDDRIEIGVFGDNREVPLYLAKHRIRAGVQTVRVVVKEPPERAGIDPLHKLIDRAIDDNTADVVAGRAPPPRAAPKAKPGEPAVPGD